MMRIKKAIQITGSYNFVTLCSSYPSLIIIVARLGSLQVLWIGPHCEWVWKVHWGLLWEKCVRCDSSFVKSFSFRIFISWSMMSVTSQLVPVHLCRFQCRPPVLHLLLLLASLCFSLSLKCHSHEIWRDHGGVRKHFGFCCFVCLFFKERSQYYKIGDSN